MLTIDEIRAAVTRLNLGNKSYRDGLHNEYADRGLLIGFVNTLVDQEPIDAEFCELLGMVYDKSAKCFYDSAGNVLWFSENNTVALSDGTTMGEIKSRGGLLALIWSMEQQ